MGRPALYGLAVRADDGGVGDRLLECAGIVRRFGDRIAVDGISFHIDRGETGATLALRRELTGG